MPRRRTAGIRHGHGLVGGPTGPQPPGSLALFGELSDEQGHQLASDAWTVGLRALANAPMSLASSRRSLPYLGSSSTRRMAKSLSVWPRSSMTTVCSPRLLEKYLAPQNSILTQTLESLRP